MTNKYIDDIRNNIQALDVYKSAYHTQGIVQNILNNLKELIPVEGWHDVVNKAYVQLELFHSKDIAKNNMKYDEARKPKATQAVKNESDSFHSYTIDQIRLILNPVLGLDLD